MSEQNKVSLSSFYGVKSGMTRIFDENGNSVPVTVVELIPNLISQVKTADKDGYNSYQVAFNEKREKLINKPFQGHLKKANLEPKFSKFAEIKNDTVNTEDLGKQLGYDLFPVDTYVDVTAVTKGRGFQGVMKKYHFQGGPASHGSGFHRAPGSIGNRATPGRVFRGKKLPGQMGSVSRTVQNLKVVEVNFEQGYMLIKGSLPGSKSTFVEVTTALKKQG